LFAQADFDVVQAQGAERDAYHGLLAAVGVSPTVVIRIEDVSRRQLQTVVRTFESKIGLAVGLCLTK
jgi:hypothetical protein